MNTKHARTVHLGGFLLQAAHKIALSCPKFICKYICKYICVCCKYFCDQVVQRIRLYLGRLSAILQLEVGKPPGALCVHA